MNKKIIITLLAMGLILATMAPSSVAGPSGSWTASYVAPATVVADVGITSTGDRQGGADEGVMRCNSLTGDGTGGFCIHDPFVEALHVHDDASGPAFAYQVCRDVDLDQFCTDNETIFSHGNDGTFAFPVDVPGPLGVGQIVVFICLGVHSAGGDHTHFAFSGTGTAVPDPQPGFLNGFTAENGFCGGSTVGKRYEIDSLF